MCNMLCATWYEGTAQLLSLTELKSHFFQLHFIGWTTNKEEGEETRVSRENPDDERQKMPHTIQAPTETWICTLAYVAG